MIQFLKIILVTMQLVIFGNFRYAHTNYYADNEIGFEHLFLKVFFSLNFIFTKFFSSMQIVVFEHDKTLTEATSLTTAKIRSFMIL